MFHEFLQIKIRKSAIFRLFATLLVVVPSIITEHTTLYFLTTFQNYRIAEKYCGGEQNYC